MCCKSNAVCRFDTVWAVAAAIIVQLDTLLLSTLDRYDVDREKILLDFVANLQSFDGGRTPPTEARQIAVDVSKYLAFANQRRCQWSDLADMDRLFKYIDLLQNTSMISPNGIVTKIHRLQQAVLYLRRTGLEDIPTGVTERLDKWKASFSKDRTALSVSRGIEADTSPAVLTKIHELFSNQQLQEHLQEIKETIRSDLLLDKSEHNMLVTYLFLCLVCRNWQRRGAVINLTVSEANAPIMEDEKIIIKSLEHKTKS